MTEPPPADVPAQVLLLGTFHFADRGLDAYKPRHQARMLSDERQREVDEVLRCLERFAPAKVAVERWHGRQRELDHEYAAFRRDDLALTADEVHQIGFRLARRLEHDRVYAIDAWGRYHDPPVDLERHAEGRTTEAMAQFLSEEFDFDPPRDLRAYAEAHAQADLLGQWSERFARLAAEREQRTAAMPLLERLLVLNAEDVVLEGHGAYLVDWFKLGTGTAYPGVDFVTAWYSRNLRIFANLQRISEEPGERILVIIGAGHVPILRHCLQASPEYDLVEVSEFLGAAEPGAAGD